MNKYDFSTAKEKAYLSSVSGKLAVEVGCFMGHTTARLARNFEKVIAIDPFTAELEKQRYGNIDPYKAYLKHTRKYKNITTLLMTSLAAMPWSLNLNADFIFIDGAHDYHHAYQDIKCWAWQLKDGGTMAIHDVRPFNKRKGVFEVRRAVNELVYWGEFYDIRFVDSMVIVKYGHWEPVNILKFIYRLFSDLKYYLRNEV